MIDRPEPRLPSQTVPADFLGRGEWPEDGLFLLDAAMGTRLLESGLRLDGDDPCLWNLTHPDAVAAIHRRDVAAGSMALLTNTFGANRAMLARVAGGPGRDVAALNRAAVALARGAAGPRRLVIGDIGPTAADGGAVAEQAGHLIDAGVDALLFETHRLDQAEAALAQLGAGTPVPILVSLIAWPDPPDAALERLGALGARAVGVNCQAGMAAALEQAERLRRSTPLPLIIKPAAGHPGSRQPPDTPEAFARAVARLRAMAPLLVGGCCGTSEAHLARLRDAWYDDVAERAGPRTLS